MSLCIGARVCLIVVLCFRATVASVQLHEQEITFFQQQKKFSISLVSVPKAEEEKQDPPSEKKKKTKQRPFCSSAHRVQAGTPDGTFPTRFGFMSCIHLVESPKKVFGKQGKAERVSGRARCLLWQNKPSRLITFIIVRYSDSYFICKRW